MFLIFSNIYFSSITEKCLVNNETGYTVRNQYNLSNKIETTDENGNVTTYEYDANNNVTKENAKESLTKLKNQLKNQLINNPKMPYKGGL